MAGLLWAKWTVFFGLLMAAWLDFNPEEIAFHAAQRELAGLCQSGMRRLVQQLVHPKSLQTRFLCSSSLQSPNNKLFVGGLSWYVDEKSLKEAFSSFGEVTEVRIMYDKSTGRSRGFGFVSFSTQHEANTAKDAMDGKALLGRPLSISFAVDKVRGLPLVVPRISSLR